MLSVIGGDHMGLGAREHLKSLGVDVSKIDVQSEATSAIYLSILNHDSDMELAISDMDVVKLIVPEFLEKNADFILSSKAVALDGNLENHPRLSLLMETWKRRRLNMFRKDFLKYRCFLILYPQPKQ